MVHAVLAADQRRSSSIRLAAHLTKHRSFAMELFEHCRLWIKIKDLWQHARSPGTTEDLSPSPAMRPMTGSARKRFHRTCLTAGPSGRPTALSAPGSAGQSSWTWSPSDPRVGRTPPQCRGSVAWGVGEGVVGCKEGVMEQDAPHRHRRGRGGMSRDAGRERGFRGQGTAMEEEAEVVVHFFPTNRSSVGRTIFHLSGGSARNYA